MFLSFTACWLLSLSFSYTNKRGHINKTIGMVSGGWDLNPSLLTSWDLYPLYIKAVLPYFEVEMTGRLLNILRTVAWLCNCSPHLCPTNSIISPSFLLWNAEDEHSTGTGGPPRKWGFLWFLHHQLFPCPRPPHRWRRTNQCLYFYYTGWWRNKSVI